MIRILVFTTLYPNASQPRHGIFVEERLRHLLATGEVEAKVVAPVPWFPSRSPWFGRYATYPTIPAREVRHGIEVLHPRYPVIPKIGMGIAPTLLGRSLLPALRRVIEGGYDFELIDSHYFYPDGVAAAWLGKSLGKPVAITARGTDVNLIPRYRWPRRQVLWACDNAGAIVAVSEALKTALAELGVNPQRITVLRNGVDLSVFRPSDGAGTRKALGVTGPVWLSVGHLVERKGHHIAIEAVSRHPDVTLLIIGDGPEGSALRRFVRRLDVERRVRFLGHIEHSQLPEYYCAADALVLASSREGMPNVVLESIACGTPVIATAIWGTPEVISSAVVGELMEERTPAALSAAWQRLRARGSSKAEIREHARQFSWDSTSAGQAKLFREALSTEDASIRR